MGRVFKWLLAIALLVVGILAIAAVILVAVFDPNDYKDQIASLVKDKTGRELRIEQDIRLTLFPRLGVALGKAQLSNAPGFGKQPFARVGSASVSLKLLPLLRKRIEVDQISLDGLALNLMVDKQGRDNWSDLLAGESKREVERSGPSEASPASIEALRIGGLDVRSLTVDYEDQRTGSSQRITLRQLRTGEIVPGSDVPVTLELAARSDQPPADAVVKADATLKIAPGLRRFEMPDLRAKLQLRADDTPPIDAALRAGLVYDLTADRFALSSLKLTRGDVRLTGELRGTALSTAPRLDGSFSLAAFSLRALLTELGIPPDTRDPKALSRFALDLHLAKTPKRIELDDLVVRLDDSTLKGKAAIAGSGKPAIDFDLAVDRLDLDRYLPKRAPASNTGAAVSPKAPAEKPLALPVGPLRELDLDGRLRIARLTLNGLHLNDAVLAVRAKRGVIALKPLAARLYGGSLSVNAAMNLSARQPVWTIDNQLKGVQIGPLLRDLNGKDPLITGTANLSGKLKTRGLDDAAWRRNLDGSARFSFLDGALQGYDLAGIIRQAMAALKGRHLELKGPRKTDFAEMKGSLRIRHGVARNDDFSLKSPFLRVRGKGTIDLPKERLDYLLTAKLVGSLKGQGGEDLDKLKGVPIPVRIRGPFRDPSIKPDLQSILKEAAKRKLLDKVKAKAGGKLDGVLKRAGGGGLDKALKGLFH